MFISTDWNGTSDDANEDDIKDNQTEDIKIETLKNEITKKLIIIIEETTFEKTLLTINSLFSNESIIDEFDINIPLDSYKNHFNTDFQIYIIKNNKNNNNECSYRNDFQCFDSFDTFLTSSNEASTTEASTNEPSKESLKNDINKTSNRYMLMKGGYYSISYTKLLELSNDITLPTLFNTLPYKLNFYSENSFMIPSLDFHNQLIELAITNKININDSIIGIDKNRYKKYFESELLSSVRIALVLNTDIKYCKYAFDKLNQLSKAKKSIRMKFRDLKKSLTSKITNDKVIKSYIKLLDSFSNYCSKEDYIFYCMMLHPDLYQKAVNMKIFLNSLMEIDPNKTDKRTLYDLLVDYTLF